MMVRVIMGRILKVYYKGFGTDYKYKQQIFNLQARQPFILSLPPN